jgi:NADP-dependent 3-hydroxy acid dehydrogenase YdfG
MNQEALPMHDNIRDKVVVITGASSGLGAATARMLAAAGAAVVLGARRQDRIDALAAELNDAGGRALALTTDVTDPAQVQALVDAAIAHFGSVDVIVNNAGLMPQAPLERRTIADWDRTIDVNIKGVLYGIAAVLPHMQARKAGHIVSVSSVAGHKVRAGGAVYSATKHAVRVISEGLRQEVKPYGIRTTVISPGAVDTELPASSTEPDVREAMQRFYADTAIPADAFARAVVYALSQPDEVDINEILFRPTRQEY